MKSIYPLALVALTAAFAGCSSDNDNPYVKGDTDAKIAFSNPFINNSVKQRASTPATNQTLDEFRVWGFVVDPSSVVFDGNKVERSGASWTVDRTEYWYTGQNYWFSAVAPYDNKTYTFTPVSTPSESGYKGGGTLTFHNDIAEGETDLVYAFNGPVNHPEGTTEFQPVGMTFNHLLSQVSFKFVNSVSASTTLTVRNLRILNVPSAATINLNQDSENVAWEITPGSTFNLSDIDTEGSFSYTAPNNSIESEQAYIIPSGTEIQYQVSFDVDVYNGNNKMATYTHTIDLPANTNFIMGQSYRFTATFTGDNLTPGGLKPIEFTVDEINEWNMVDGGDID